jgi:putative aldouronate transport system permease protein
MSTPTVNAPPPGAVRPEPEVRAATRRVKPPKLTWRRALRRDWQLYSLAILPLVFFLIFRYLPMLGNIIAFRRFQPGGSVFGEYWVGLRYVKMFLNDPTFWEVFTNTLILGGLTLMICFPLPIVLALLLNEVRTRYLKR